MPPVSLEQQINREARKGKEEPQPLLRVTGDLSAPLVSALLALPIPKRTGLIEVNPIAGSALSIQAIPRASPLTSRSSIGSASCSRITATKRPANSSSAPMNCEVQK